jgi:hypothetical protein
MHQQCRKNPPVCFPVPSNKGPVLFGGFPGLPHDDSGCGQHEPADGVEMERREREHPRTVREVPDKPRLVT